MEVVVCALPVEVIRAALSVEVVPLGSPLRRVMGQAVPRKVRVTMVKREKMREPN